MYRILFFLSAIQLCFHALSQNVGIGEISPSARLEVKGSTSTLQNSLLVKDGNNIPLMSVSNQGRLGINTANPSVPLHVYSPSSSEMVRFDGNSPYISFYDANIYSGYVWSNSISMQIGTPLGSVRPVTVAPGNVVTTTFKSDGSMEILGNVGIGVFNPVYRLEVDGRIRLRHNVETAGVWFNNSSNSFSPAFLGMYDDTHIGFYGSTFGWGLLVNTLSGTTSMAGDIGVAGDANVFGNINSGGSAQANNFVYNTPVTRYLSVPFTDFKAASSSEVLIRDLGVYSTTNGPFRSIKCGVHLPQGAIVTNVAFNIYDVSGVNDFNCFLYRQPLSAVSLDMMAFAHNTGNPGNTVINDNSIVSPVINNQNNFYWLLVSPVRFDGTEGAWDGIFLQLRGVVITYTMMQAE